MSKKAAHYDVVIPGMIGQSAGRRVFLAFAPADLLHRISFADVLDEDSGHGYQRRFNSQHSLDFRKYIQHKNSSTIPLTFNLRPRVDAAWRLKEGPPPQATLEINSSAGKVLAQVDCQHRMGHLNDLPVSLPFMCYLGLSEREEMETFNVINSKAKGLSTSLLDFHDARLTDDLAQERPELLIALHLNSNTDSPWYRQLDLGGNSTSGLLRRASLRTMQKAIKGFLRQIKGLPQTPELTAQFVLDFWSVIAFLLREAWDHPRQYLINKGVGVYALMGIAADLYKEAHASGQSPDRRFLTNRLAEFITEINWSGNGPLGGLGGEGGVKTALQAIRATRNKKRLKLVRHAK